MGLAKLGHCSLGGFPRRCPDALAFGLFLAFVFCTVTDNRQPSTFPSTFPSSSSHLRLACLVPPRVVASMACVSACFSTPGVFAAKPTTTARRSNRAARVVTRADASSTCVVTPQTVASRTGSASVKGTVRKQNEDRFAGYVSSARPRVALFRVSPDCQRVTHRNPRRTEARPDRSHVRSAETFFHESFPFCNPVDPPKTHLVPSSLYVFKTSSG